MAPAVAASPEEAWTEGYSVLRTVRVAERVASSSVTVMGHSPPSAL